MRGALFTKDLSPLSLSLTPSPAVSIFPVSSVELSALAAKSCHDEIVPEKSEWLNVPRFSQWFISFCSLRSSAKNLPLCTRVTYFTTIKKRDFINPINDALVMSP